MERIKRVHTLAWSPYLIFHPFPFRNPPPFLGDFRFLGARATRRRASASLKVPSARSSAGHETSSPPPTAGALNNFADGQAGARRACARFKPVPLRPLPGHDTGKILAGNTIRVCRVREAQTGLAVILWVPRKGFYLFTKKKEVKNRVSCGCCITCEIVE